MQAVHEMGHVIGAFASGGTVQYVELNPLDISRTDVQPNPKPGFVVWMGPIIGCLLPLLVAGLLGRAPQLVKSTLMFFAGFCLVANGAYVGGGAIPEIGDCKTMLKTGAPVWAMMTFGVTAVANGLLIWHRLGDLATFLENSNAASTKANCCLALGLLAWLASTIFLSV